MIKNDNIQIDKFDDVRILRFNVPNFETLNLKDKILIYHLSEASLYGRDILFDQNFKYNLVIKDIFETIFVKLRNSETGEEWDNFVIYLKKIWFANGIHHHYSTEKFTPKFSKDYLQKVAKKANVEVSKEIENILFDKTLFSKRVWDNSSEDLIKNSANNFYEGVTQKEAENYYANLKGKEMHGLNSKLTKVNDKIVEERWFAKGGYGKEIKKIISHLQEAEKYAQNESQKEIIKLLVRYYETGDLKLFDEYSIKWLKDTTSDVDFINGFIEVYGDALGFKGSWEAMVNIKDVEATKMSQIISDNAQWFEDRSPIQPCYRKDKVKGVSSKVINAIMLGGDSYPATPIGINLPNADWIRKEYGSKSVSIHNITASYEKASQGSGLLEEFYFSKKEVQRAKLYGEKAGNLHTELHECLGHGSGQLAKGIKGDELKSYGSPLEEARADLFALYFMADKKLQELGIVENDDFYKSEYYSYIFNGLMGQLSRIEKGKDVVQAHMRCRKTISSWCFEQGKTEKIIEIIKKEDKHFVIVNDYEKLRNLFGKLLCEVQRIKSEGDYEAGKKLIETYGVKVDLNIHEEILKRYATLNLAPYSGFVNPVLEIVKDDDGKIEDVNISYCESYTEQMLRYSNINK